MEFKNDNGKRDVNKSSKPKYTKVYYNFLNNDFHKLFLLRETVEKICRLKDQYYSDLSEVNKKEFLKGWKMQIDWKKSYYDKYEPEHKKAFAVNKEYHHLYNTYLNGVPFKTYKDELYFKHCVTYFTKKNLADFSYLFYKLRSTINSADAYCEFVNMYYSKCLKSPMKKPKTLDEISISGNHLTRDSYLRNAERDYK